MPILTQNIGERALNDSLAFLPIMRAHSTRGYQTVQNPRMHITILGPYNPHQKSWEHALVAERSFGEELGWERPFRDFARGKAKLAWKHQRSSAAVQTTPQCLDDGDVLLTGGVYLDGVAVGVSGWEPILDELLANIVASCCVMLCKEAALALEGAGMRTVPS